MHEHIETENQSLTETPVISEKPKSPKKKPEKEASPFDTAKTDLPILEAINHSCSVWSELNDCHFFLGYEFSEISFSPRDWNKEKVAWNKSLFGIFIDDNHPIDFLVQNPDVIYSPTHHITLADRLLDTEGKKEGLITLWFYHDLPEDETEVEFFKAFVDEKADFIAKETGLLYSKEYAGFYLPIHVTKEAYLQALEAKDMKECITPLLEQLLNKTHLAIPVFTQHVNEVVEFRKSLK